MSKKGDMTGFSILIAIIIALLVVFFLAYYFYPQIPIFGQKGIDAAKSSSLVGRGIDLMVTNRTGSTFNCSGNYVKVYNLGEVDALDVRIDISGAVPGRTIYLDLPSGSAIPVQIDSNSILGVGIITVEVDPLDNVSEKLEANNIATKSC